MSRGFQQDADGKWVPFDDDLPPGMICRDCGERHFYDFLDKPVMEFLHFPSDVIC